MFTIEEDIIKIMKENGWEAKVVTKMFPIWTTDWLTDEAREKLRLTESHLLKKEQTNIISGNRKNVRVAVLNIQNRSADSDLPYVRLRINV
jgi:metal-sulfur cluster biosynthetic enzyme